MRSVIATLSRLWAGFLKRAGDVIDVFKPRGYVEARLIYASGPKKGQVAQVIRGRNVVTGFLGEAHLSGRDLMRRKLAPAAFAGSLATDGDAVIGQMVLGSGTTAETSADIALESELAPAGSSKKAITDVIFDASNPYVTFVAEWAESEVNDTISEVALLSTASPEGFLARKTFGSFTKTGDFTLQIRWQIRF
jgi:hypothetical protein